MRKIKLIPGFLLGFFVIGSLLLSVSTPMAATAPKGAPAEFKVGFVDFISGQAATFGISGKDTTEWLVAKWNREGGIRGVPITTVILDEAGGPKKQVAELRRLVLDEKVDAIVGYTSSGNCLAIGPVAEELKILTVAHICGTHRLTEDHKLKYVFRTSNHQAADSLMLARYVLKLKPDVKTIAGINEDYAWGRDSWENFRLAIQALKPDIKVKVALWTKFQPTDTSSEISRLLAARPDVIHSSFWGGGLITFIKQAAPRGLFKQSLVALSTGAQVLQNVGKAMPDGVIVEPRATGGYFLDPDPATDPMQKEYVEGIYKAIGRYPDYVGYRTYQAWAGLKTAYEKAIDILGRWPTTEEVIKAFEDLSWKIPGGYMIMRKDHQAIGSGMVGITKMSEKYGFAILVDRVRYWGEDIMPPVNVKSFDWVKTIK